MCDTFARRLRCVRRRRGWTQRDLAESAGLSHGAVSQLETEDREPLLSTVRAIAQALGVGLEALCGVGDCPGCSSSEEEVCELSCR